MELPKRLEADQRIRRQTTFKSLVEKGQFVRGEFFYLWVEKRDSPVAAERKKPALGIIVSRKTEPTAVGRNRWKRHVREIFRDQQANLRPDAVCLVKVRGAKIRPPFLSLKKELLDLFKKAGVWA